MGGKRVTRGESSESRQAAAQGITQVSRRGRGQTRGNWGWSMTEEQIQILFSLLSSCTATPSSFSLYFLSLQQYKCTTLEQEFKSWLAVQGGRERERENGDPELCKLEEDGRHEREKGRGHSVGSHRGEEGGGEEG